MNVKSANVVFQFKQSQHALRVHWPLEEDWWKTPSLLAEKSIMTVIHNIT